MKQPSEHVASTEKSIEAAFREYLGDRDPFLVGVELKRGKTDQLWVFLDSEHADVTIEQCTQMSRELSDWLDESDRMPGEFRLNVSSPGLDRPLTDVRQYAKNKGRVCRIETGSHEEQKTYQGTLVDVLEDALVISKGSKKDRATETIQVPFSDIKEIKIIPVFHS